MHLIRRALTRRPQNDALIRTRSHLPLMFVGMEHIVLSNRSLADEALNAAYSICDSDPLLVNERAVMAYNREE